MKTNRNSEEEVENLRRELQGVRRASLLAARTGDFMKSGKLTSQAASLNKAIMAAEGLSSLDIA